MTIAFNHFGVELIQRMPRCRLGYFHIVNNDFTEWKMYAIGGSANPTINSQGNRYMAPSDPDAKEVFEIISFVWLCCLFEKRKNISFEDGNYNFNSFFCCLNANRIIDL